MTTLLNAAVIGVGSMGENHVRVYRKMEGVRLVAVMDGDAKAATRVGNEYGVSAYSSLERLFDQERIDLVSVAVPTDRHFNVGMEVIERGVNLLIEKPLAQSIEQGEELIEAARKAEVTLAVGHIERFNPVIVELCARLEEGIAGQIYKICTQRLSPYPTRIKDVGVVIDLATHDINLIPFLAGKEIIRLHGETHVSINAQNKREDLFHGVIRFADGLLGVLDVDWMTPKKVRRLTVTGAKGLIECDLISQRLEFYENGTMANGQWNTLSVLGNVTEGDVHGYHIRRQEPLALELRDFVAAVRELRAPKVTGEDGLKTLRLAMQFLQSAEAGQELRLS